MGIEVEVVFHRFGIFGAGDEIFVDAPALLHLNELGRFLEDHHADPSVGKGSGGCFCEAAVQLWQEGAGNGKVLAPGGQGDGRFDAGHDEDGMIVLVFRPHSDEGTVFFRRFAQLFFLLRKEGMAQFIIGRHGKGGQVLRPHFFPSFVMGHRPDFRLQIVFRASCHGKQDDEQKK